MLLTYIIVEDQKGALENLKMAMNDFSEYTFLGHARSIAEALLLIETQKPHIVFLDVELGNENGIEILKKIKVKSNHLPLFIMNTIYDQHAQEGINNDVVYFLDKPIDQGELSIALNKCRRIILDLQDCITIKNSEGHHFIELRKVQYIKSVDNTCMLFRDENSKMCVTKTLKDFESLLPNYFVRIHKSYIVNKHYVEMINTTSKYVRLNFEDISSKEKIQLPIGSNFLEKSRYSFLFS